jgi:sugar/nucleoside kinase (ribokinase family)
MDVLAVGLTTLDILGYPIDALPPEDRGELISGIDVVPAGTAGGFALVAAVLGLRTGLISALGADRIGRFVRLILEEQGVDTSLVPTLPGLPSSATILPIDSHGRRPTLHAPGAAMLTEITEAAILAAGQARHVHWAAIGGMRVDATLRTRFLQAARDGGASLSCDLIAPGPGAAAELQAVLPFIDTFMPSLTEALQVTGAATAEAAAAAALAMGARRCIVKLGAAGVLLADTDGVRTVPAFKVDVVDTTSCGDAFCAGFVAGQLQGWDVMQSARCGAATAAFVAQGLGTLGALQGFAQVRAAMETLQVRAASDVSALAFR